MRGLRWLREMFWPADPIAGFDADRWLEAVRAAQPAAVALVVPRWVGVANATSQLFPWVVPIPPVLSRRAARRVAQLLMATGVPRIVFGSFTVGMGPLLDLLAQARPEIELFAMYHSNLLHQ